MFEQVPFFMKLLISILILIVDVCVGIMIFEFAGIQYENNKLIGTLTGMAGFALYVLFHLAILQTLGVF